MYKKIIIIILSMFVVSLAIIYILLMEYHYWHIWSHNRWTVFVKAPLQSGQLKIYHCNTVECPIRINQWELNELKNHSAVRSIFDGETLVNIRPEYGENDFYIIYDDYYALAFRQFKTNRNYLHDYQFTVWQENNVLEPMVRVDIQGTNDMSFESKMFKIE